MKKRFQFEQRFHYSCFHYRDCTVYWDIYKNSNMKIQRRETTDANFKTNSGIEIGVLEIKPFNISPELIEEDRVRLAEISKKVLHRRVLNAKSKKELRTFAIMIAGESIEYLIHEYHPDESFNTKKYTFRLVKKSILPTFPKTFSSMSLALESLTHFKKLMLNSIASSSEVESPYLYTSQNQAFEPTVTLLKLDDE